MAGNWIVEGTYRESYHDLFTLADEIVFLDPPLALRRKRIFLRYFKQKCKLEKSRYTPSLKMLRAMCHWTSEFEANRSKFLQLLEEHANSSIIIKNPSELDAFVLSLKTRQEKNA